MNESINLIKYFYQQGIYDIKDMNFLVQSRKISKQDFFQITRFVYSEKGEIKK